MDKLTRPITTLFMLSSLDGKISSGSTDNLDSDIDWKNIAGVKDGLHQYYEIEQTTDIYSFNTGRVMEKIGTNEKSIPKEKTICSFIIVDNKPHLNEKGIDYMCNWSKRLILVTTNKLHPAFQIKDKYDNLDILYYEELNLEKL